MRLRLPLPRAGTRAFRVTVWTISLLVTLALFRVNEPPQAHSFIAVYGIFFVAAAWGDGLDLLFALLVFALVVLHGPDTLDAARPARDLAVLVYLTNWLVFFTLARRLRRSRDQALKTSREAQVALRVRDDVLMAASHDLRTPLTLIQGHTDLLLMRLERDAYPDTGEIKRQVDAIRAGSGRLRETIEEITDAAQLHMGRTLEMPQEAVNLEKAVESAIGRLATRPGQQVPVRVTAEDDVEVPGDRVRLLRVFQTVIGNGIKYLHYDSHLDGHVQVDIFRDGAYGFVRVTDDGVGMRRQDLAHVFDRFYRGAHSVGPSGTGIGLAGARSIVEQHGGYIAVKSAYHKGTVVTVVLPLSVPTDAGGDCAVTLPDYAETLEGDDV